MRKTNADVLKPGTIYKIRKSVGESLIGSAIDSGQVELTAIPQLSTVKVVGVVEAGAWRDVESTMKELFSIAIPPGAAAGTEKYGLEVRGESMNRRYPHGTIVVCVKAIEAGREPKEGERVIVERTQNGLVEATVKEWRDGKLWPDSDDPDHQEPLDVPKESEDGHEAVTITGYVVGSYRPE